MLNTYQNPYQPQYRMNSVYTPSYGAVPYQQPQFTPQQPTFQQDGSVPARLVSGREEAVASNVMPGSIFLFYDRAHGMIFAKYLDPQTGVAEFRTFQEAANPAQEAPQTAPEYVTMDLFRNFQTDLERRFEAFQTPSKKTGKAVSDDV